MESKRSSTATEVRGWPSTEYAPSLSMNYQVARSQLTEAYQHSLFFVNHKRSSSSSLFHDTQYITGTVSKKSEVSW